MADLEQHLQVESRAGTQPLGFQQFAFVPELLQLLLQLFPDRLIRRGPSDLPA